MTPYIRLLTVIPIEPCAISYEENACKMKTQQTLSIVTAYPRRLLGG